MAQVGDIGTLQELGVMPGDKVKCVGTGGKAYRERYKDTVWTCVSKHPRGYSVDPCVVYKDKRGGGWLPCTNPRWTFQLISRAAPTLWRDMTPAQRAAVPQSVLDDPHNPFQVPWGEWSRAAKGAALLANHERKVIECCTVSGRWGYVNPSWDDHTAYRVRPEPIRVDLMAEGAKVGTVAMIDGKVDPKSVEWDK